MLQRAVVAAGAKDHGRVKCVKEPLKHAHLPLCSISVWMIISALLSYFPRQLSGMAREIRQAQIHDNPIKCNASHNKAGYLNHSTVSEVVTLVA